MSEYRLSRLATSDLAAIYRFSNERFGAAQADVYAVQFSTAARLLASNRQMGAACDQIRAGYRRHRVGSHMLYYTVAPDHVLIVRVLHGRMNPHTHP